MLNHKEFQSREELWFYSWVLELKSVGFVNEILYEPLTFLLAEKQTIIWNKQLKTKIKPVEKVIQNEVVYTPDFLIHWNTEVSDGILTGTPSGNYNRLPLFHLDESCCTTFVEIKGTHDRLGTSRDTKTKMSWVFAKYGQKVHLIKPLLLFAHTFYPELYLINDSMKADRKKRHKGRLVPLRDGVPGIKKYVHDRNN